MAARSLVKILFTAGQRNVLSQNLAKNVKFYSAAAASPRLYEFIKFEKSGVNGNVAIITLNRPKALNAICTELMDEICDAISIVNNDNKMNVIVITGSEKVFAAGADIKQMKNSSFTYNYKTNFAGSWDRVANSRKPIIAAINGYAVGGACELAMMCDIIYVGESARFSLPEVKIGTNPGAGGTQRLPRYVGKSKAMEIVLTGNHINATEAERMGLVSKVFPVNDLLQEAIKLADKIAANSPLIVALAKEAVNTAYETTLKQGLDYEKRSFHATFATEDQKEGMTAFVEKRPSNFKNN